MSYPPHLAIGLYVAYLEPFFVKSLRRVMDQIRDEALREDADRFSRQEAQHYRRHMDFNKAVLTHGYPGLAQRTEMLKRDFEGFLAAVHEHAVTCAVLPPPVVMAMTASPRNPPRVELPCAVRYPNRSITRRVHWPSKFVVFISTALRFRKYQAPEIMQRCQKA